MSSLLWCCIYMTVLSTEFPQSSETRVWLWNIIRRHCNNVNKTNQFYLVLVPASSQLSWIWSTSSSWTPPTLPRRPWQSPSQLLEPSPTSAAPSPSSSLCASFSFLDSPQHKGKIFFLDHYHCALAFKGILKISWQKLLCRHLNMFFQFSIFST